MNAEEKKMLKSIIARWHTDEPVSGRALQDTFDVGYLVGLVSKLDAENKGLKTVRAKLIK